LALLGSGKLGWDQDQPCLRSHSEIPIASLLLSACRHYPPGGETVVIKKVHSFSRRLEMGRFVMPKQVLRRTTAEFNGPCRLDMGRRTTVPRTCATKKLMGRIGLSFGSLRGGWSHHHPLEFSLPARIFLRAQQGRMLVGLARVCLGKQQKTKGVGLVLAMRHTTRNDGQCTPPSFRHTNTCVSK
jgi:hypothetical protein